MKKYGWPLLTIFAAGILVRIENMFIKGSSHHFFYTLTLAIAFFALGVCLQPKRKNKTWVKKLIVSFVFFLLILYDLGALKPAFLEKIFAFAGIYQFSLYLLYLYLGWLFFD